LLVLVAFIALVMGATTFAAPPPGSPSGEQTPPTQAFEEFSIRLEPALGSPRCSIADQGLARCEPVGWLSTRSQNYVNVRGEAYLRSSAETPAGVQMSSSFVASQNDTNVAVQFSAEAYVEDDHANSFRRMFVRALVDGATVNPSNVVFATTAHQGTQSFIFTTNVNAGIHTVEIQWKVDTEATGFMRDASLLVRMGRDDASEKGTLTTKTAPSGLNQVTNSQAWGDVPGMSVPVYVPKSGLVTASFSGEVFTSKSKRFMLRALLDGAPMNPGDVALTSNPHASSQAMTFGAKNVASGWHTVTVQWFVEAGGTASVGDRSLVVSALPVRSEGGSHQFVAAPSGANVYTLKDYGAPLPMQDMAIKFDIPKNGNGEVAVQFSAEIDATDSAEATVVLVIDGELQLDGMVQATDGSQAAQVKSFVFEAKGLSAGSHTAEIWFASGEGGQAYVGDRTMSLMSETGFIPDLAEAPKFSGGHIGMDEDYLAGVEALIGTRKVLAILIDPGLCEGTVDADGDPCYNQFNPAKGKVESAIWGSSTEPGWGLPQMDNIATYFAATSGDRFTIERAGTGIAGWFQTDHPSDMYYNNDGKNCVDGYDHGPSMLIGEAVRKADVSVNFASFDTNGDGKLGPQELAILIVVPRPNGDGSAKDPLYGSTCGDNTRMELDNVQLPMSVAKWNTSLDEGAETFQYTTAAHELMHLIGGLDDMHLNDELAGPLSTYPDDMSLMAGNRWTTTHLDPFHKLAFGWVTPVIVHETGQVTIGTVNKTNTVYILPRYNNTWEEEYYILENRKQGMGFPWYDEDINSSGIVVWHIVTDPVENQNTPIGTLQSAWDKSHIPSDKPTSKGQMARNGIRLLRPFIDIIDGQPIFPLNSRAWNQTNYSLESGNCVLVVPLGQTPKNKLSWADCQASGYSIAFLDNSIENMMVNVKVN
jgi:M6 family metalloprotease-like protein